LPNIANMIDRAGQGHSLCEFLLGKSRSYYLSRKHDDFAELCDDENKLGSDSIAVVGPLVAGAAIAIWDRGLSYTLIATQLLIVLWGLYRFTSSPKSEHNGSFPMQPSVRSEPPLLLLI
jgi:hypothetical protein